MLLGNQEHFSFQGINTQWIYCYIDAALMKPIISIATIVLFVANIGEITYCGIPVKDEKYKNILGYLPQEFGYYPEFSAKGFLMYFAALKGIEKQRAKIAQENIVLLSTHIVISTKAL